ncbi:MAG: hypothetical protein Q7J21_06615 [Rugosibacter sp.]|nr:hypothetical protein [Rugosibacter sp.]
MHTEINPLPPLFSKHFQKVNNHNRALKKERVKLCQKKNQESRIKKKRIKKGKHMQDTPMSMAIGDVNTTSRLLHREWSLTLEIANIAHDGQRGRKVRGEYQPALDKGLNAR